MSGDGAVTQDQATGEEAVAAPAVLRRLVSRDAVVMSGLAATFEDLQTVLRCCERLMGELAPEQAPPDGVLVEAVWTMALLSYARCFREDGTGVALTAADLASSTSSTQVRDWHEVLLRLRDHYADPVANPRERFSVGVGQDGAGGPSGVAVTSSRQPLVDDVTVRQLGAIAYSLSTLVDERIAAQQQLVFAALASATKADLDQLELLEVTAQAGG